MVRILIPWFEPLLMVFKVKNSRLSLRVHFCKYILLFTLVSVTTVLLAQEIEEEGLRTRSRVIDDTTKQVYGPTTTHYFFEEDYFYNRIKAYPVDTVIRNFHRFNYVQRNNNLYQDLGNIGTAIQPIYNQMPATVGVTPGFDAYNLYWDSEKVKYFDTKSPYSNMHVILGGKGRSMTRVVYSRNINPQWNFGFDYRGLFIDKLIQRSGKGDRHVRSNYYDLFTSYKSKDSTYSLFFNYQRNFQQSDEYGGVRVEDSLSWSELFRVNAQPWLTEAESNDKRSNVHLYQQYRLGGGFQLYHKIDLYHQQNQFRDTYTSEPDEYFDAVVVDSARSRDQINFRSIRNEMGIKGNLLKLFYNGYAAVRSYSMDYRYFYEEYLPVQTKGDELYVGGRMELQLDSLVTINGEAELLLDNNYRIVGSIRTKWFEAGIKRAVAKASFLHQAYRGSHDIWIKNFINTEYNELRGNLIYRSDFISVYPGLRFVTLRNYIFFKEGDFNSDQRVLPVQSTGFQTYSSPELRLTITPVKNLTLSGYGVYTRMLENAEDAIQLPELFVNGQLAYANIWFNGNFDFQIGVDVHYKSSYFAPGYDPVIQSFYTQQQFKVPDFPVLDIFLNAKIKRGRIFLKYNNVLKAFSDYAAVPTPFYPGIKNFLDFGFDWSFYD
jgi:hypothetical protein